MYSLRYGILSPSFSGSTCFNVLKRSCSSSNFHSCFWERLFSDNLTWISVLKRKLPSQKTLLISLRDSFNWQLGSKHMAENLNAKKTFIFVSVIIIILLWEEVLIQVAHQTAAVTERDKMWIHLFPLQENVDIYSTNEPQGAFHQRVSFCLDLYNQSVRVCIMTTQLMRAKLNWFM